MKVPPFMKLYIFCIWTDYKAILSFKFSLGRLHQNLSDIWIINDTFSVEEIFYEAYFKLYINDVQLLLF